MNQEYALARRRDLHLIISSYEGYLRSQILQSPNKVTASEVLVTRDVVRSIAMSEVSKTRIQRITKSDQPAPAIDSLSTSTQSQSLVENNTQNQLQPTSDTAIDANASNNLFKNLKDCLPCNQNWSLKDFDWDRLREMLEMDLTARFRFLLNIEDLLTGNKILDNLCAFLHALKDLCPDSLLALIGVLTAYLGQALDRIEFNLASALNDLLGTLLRPYIGGLEDFLTLYIQFLVDQIDCILNAIQVSAETLRDAQISNDRGPQDLRFKKELTTNEADRSLDDIAQRTQRARDFIKENKPTTDNKNNFNVADLLRSITRQVLAVLEANLTKAQDAVVDLLGGEWLLTQENISWAEQVKAVATIIDICEVIVNLGNIEELCTEDNIRKVVEDLNKKRIGDIFIEENSTTSTVRASPNTIGAQTERGLSTQRFAFSIGRCLSSKNRADKAILERYMAELQ